MLLMGTWSGCSKENSDGGPPLIKIAVIPKATNHEFWKSVHAGALKAQLELDGVQIIWEGPVKENDRDAQIGLVEHFANGGVAGIVLAPLDDTALIRPVQEAMKAGVPVVIMDSGLKAEEGKDYVSFVATDNLAGGRLAADRMGELLGGKGTVLVMRYLVGSASTTDREEGFLDSLKEKFPDIRVLPADEYAGATTGEAYDKSQHVLGRIDKLDGVFCPCEPVAYGMLLALRDAKLAGKVKLVAFDTSVELVAAMAKGEVHGLVLQDPIGIGCLSVKTLVAHLRGGDVQKRIKTGCVLATAANMKEPEIHARLWPPFEKYLK